MDSSNGSGSDSTTTTTTTTTTIIIKPPSHQQLEKKRLNRAPSPARPFLKDVHSRSSKPPALVPKSPKLSKQQQAPTTSSSSAAHHNRNSRRHITVAKDKTTVTVKSITKSTTPKKTTSSGTKQAPPHAPPPEPRGGGRPEQHATSSPLLAKGKKGKLASISLSPIGYGGSPIRVPTGSSLGGRVSQTDSSSDLSDCPSEPLSDEQQKVVAAAASSDAESGTGSSDRDQVVGADNPLQAESSSETAAGDVEAVAAAAAVHSQAVEAASAAEGGMAQAQSGSGGRGAHGERCEQEKTSAQFKLHHHGAKRLIEDDLLREIEDLRSENDYLKDEVEELRAEMEEVRDSYLEEEVYQGQELRRELDRSNKNCRILQYRLRKAEQKSLRAAQTGHVDGELLRNLEQDLKVAKDVSVRLHNELESVEDKRSRAEDENETLRQKIIEVEISKQAVHNELDRAKETALRRRGSRESFKDKKSMSQEDSADLRCQLQFAKEESTLMRKKMAKLGREKDELEQELQKYKSVYGDVDSPLPLAECSGGGPHSTREAELRLRLKLVEEEANILGRKIVELEVENRSLRAENEDIRCQYERDCFGREPFSSMPSSPYGGDALESANELRRHLQFVEEEAELLRRSISEIEDHNKQLTSELNRFKFGPATGPCGGGGGGGGAAAIGEDVGGEGGSYRPSNGNGGLVMMEELKAARMQINELSGKVMKLQYENRVLMSNVQRCDLAAHLGMRTGSPRDSDAESDAGRREAAAAAEDEEAAGRLLLLQPKREGPVGGESDSEDLFEKTGTTSGFGSIKPSEGSELSAVELATRRREDRESLSNVKREADRLGKTVDRLITDTDSLVFEGRLLATAGDSPDGSAPSGGLGSPKPDPQVLDTINTRMKAFRTELHIFMEKVDHLGEGMRDRTDDLSPMPNLTESSSFLSTVTSMSRDSPIGTLGRDLTSDFQSGQRDELEWRLGQERGAEPHSLSQGGGHPGGQGSLGRAVAVGLTRYHHRPLALNVELRDTAGSEIQFRLEHERRHRVPDREAVGSLPQSHLEEEEQQQRACLEARRGGLQLQGLQGHEGPWAQERGLLQQELRLFRHNTVIFYMKLRWILMHWRLDRRTDPADEAPHHPEFEKMEGIPELGVISEQADEETGSGDRQGTSRTPGGDLPDQGPTFPDPQQHQRQFGENRRMLQALRTLLEEFRVEVREEEARRRQLQQSYANDKAAWEVKWAQMKCQATAQLEDTRGEAQGGEGGSGGGGGGGVGGSPEERGSPRQQEREEHQRLLAESHNASLDLRWKLQHGERRWGRERAELLERQDRERQEWDSSARELHRKMERMQRELTARRAEGADFKEGGLAPPRSPRSPRSPSAAARSHSESDTAVPEDIPGARARLKAQTESLFLDALSLDPMGGLEAPPPSRLDSEKRFPCMKEALNEISERESGPEYPEEEMGGGNLFRAKSVCSMSDFQRLMDSSPFLPDKSRHGDQERDDATPPLSPDDLKYIEEFNSKGWDFPPAEAAGHVPLLEAWASERPLEAHPDPFQPPAWFLTTSATLTTSTLSSPEHCHAKAGLRGAGGALPAGPAGADHYGVHILHSPPRPLVVSECAAADADFLYPRGSKSRGGAEGVSGVAVPDDTFGVGGGGGGARWSGQPPICPTVGYATSLDLQLSRNLSDDMKEVAFSVRNAIRSPQGPALRDTACQTNGFTTRGTQTTQTISVGLQTDALRNLTSSPHRCHTPKGGGSTPISSPSRSTRKVQYSPVGQSKFERPCCSPKYGSPKLQRKMSASGKAAAAAAELAPACSRTPPPAVPATPAGAAASNNMAPQKGNSESAWARSTTTRDSPVHTTINDGLSSLFNIIDHTPVAYDPLQKFNKSPSRARATPPPTAEPSPSPAHAPPDPRVAVSVAAAQEFPRTCRGRSPSPVQLVTEPQGERTPEVGGGSGGGAAASIRQDLSAPPGYSLAENAARILNKKLLEQGCREERRPSAAAPGHNGSRDGSRHGDADRGPSGCIEDLPRSPVAPPLDSCFLRPARPAHRRPPSRWAAHSPTSSPRWSSGSQKRFTFPPPLAHSKSIPEQEEAGLQVHSPT